MLDSADFVRHVPEFPEFPPSFLGEAGAATFAQSWNDLEKEKEPEDSAHDGNNAHTERLFAKLLGIAPNSLFGRILYSTVL